MNQSAYKFKATLEELNDFELENTITELAKSLIAQSSARLRELPALAPRLLSFLDFTSLDACDNAESIEQLCTKAKALEARSKEYTWPAAVCVYGPLVSSAKRALENSKIKIAAVSCNFPSGMSPLACKVAETKEYIALGANEIDMVISRGELLAGNYALVENEIRAIKEACGEDVLLKVILETGELKSYRNIYKASQIAIRAGADFIKTSTGKMNIGATVEAAMVMLICIAEQLHTTGAKVGFKPSGGVATPGQALTYFLAVNTVLGEEFLVPRYFRIGASRLAEALQTQLR